MTTEIDENTVEQQSAKQQSSDIKEIPVEKWKGWARVVRGGTTTYRSPSGVEISNRQFHNLTRKNEQQYWDSP